MKSLSLLFAFGVTAANAQLVEASFQDATTPAVSGISALLPSRSLEVVLMIALAVATVTIQVIHKYRASRDTAHRRFE